MLLEVARFEFRQQLRSHVFWIVFVISALMVFGSVSVDELRVGLTDEGWRNGAAAIVRTHLIWSLFYMFTTAALVADAVLRDDLTGFGPIIRAAPVRRADYRIGRFVGAIAAVLVCFLSVPLALVAGAHAPWVDPASVGPTDVPAITFGLLFLGLPNLLVSAAFGFGLATATGSMKGALLGAVVLLVAYGFGSAATGTGAALLEPFGFVAYGRAIAAWTPAERDAAVPWLDGALLGNRLLWLTLASGIVTFVCVQPDLRPRPTVSDEEKREPVSPTRAVSRLKTAWPRSSRSIVLAQLAARTRLEFGQVMVTPAFGILLLLGIINAAGALWTVADPRNGPATTAVLVAALIRSFQLVTIVVAGFFAGELFWNERERRVQDLVGTTPLPDLAFVLPKLLALASTLAMMILAAAATAAVIQRVRHGAAVDLGGYLFWYVLPASFDGLLFAVLALFLQTVSANKLSGWGWTVLYLILVLTLQKLAFIDPHYQYGLYPGSPLPAGLSGALNVGWYRIYWGAAATVLAVLACCLSDCASPVSISRRLQRLPTRLRGPAGLIAAAGGLVFMAVGAILSGTGR